MIDTMEAKCVQVFSNSDKLKSMSLKLKVPFNCYVLVRTMQLSIP